MLKPAHLHRGVTLIELMIGLAILGLLITMGMPSMGAWLANSRVRSAAEGLQVGLTLARSEAMRRNQNVEFLITNDTVDLGSVPTVTASATGIHWLVRFMDPATAAYSMVQTKSGYEGSGQAEGEAARVRVAASAPQIVFRGMGGTQGLGATATFDFSNPGAGACHTTATPSPIRCLRVQVSVGGQVRLCDPTTMAPDTRVC
jgi:type IV fimbrial biogenesis protein FimT